ncbi:lytic murein transglycosylase [Acidomonas methanolica]|uniref:Lytic murein transglycosylase B n=1 Tax=Acidomonas methanolica NBRC 104435 TaxID=1231351 RepID=A0A023D6K4_ACIMT|nr:lytic murein transglycosylase [Acidomonas methanolica]MBU2653198.1 lytic murein transglycosylase [Acidomonas methanolica]TCS32147.1 membrane-bound lytic murein transglycosylase B [Acidomonas methanolica]GAJ29375.1 lytic murein transglycosylase B [Acidomonas methanolica NBRC 104435]GBQ49971.1 lytic murein transglycosylase B [Acidomonas methanolica]GEK97580.1 hypothetical protein AME01nite_00790 [Acidomonas methanolica NBRC 104435]
MLTRRTLLAALPVAVTPLSGASFAAGGYASFLASIRDEALARGLSPQIVSQALALTREPNAHVLKLDRHQPEFTLTWAQYRARVLPASRIETGRQAFAAQSTLLESVETRYGVDPRVIVGIWGLESGFGKTTGGFSVIDALATLAYDGRRSAFFRSELLKALVILDHRDISPEGMTGSYAGAMGQPQFMPSAYLRFAVDGDGDGRRDIWTSKADVFASIANYLARSGWRQGEPWGQPVQVPVSLPQSQTGRDHRRTLGQWMSAGVRRADGQPFSRPDVSGALIRPDGPGTDAFMVYQNFNVIRRYNPSDFYALGVGLLGYAVA